MILGERPLCFSGGADGSDAQFGMCAGAAGHQVYHFGFAGHRSSVPESERVLLKPEQLTEADPFLVQANLTLERRFPTSSAYADNLLRRNYFQQRDAGSIYAVVEGLDGNGRVKGGTAWAIQMFIDRHPPGPCPVHVFDQSQDMWLTWDGLAFVQAAHVPPPAGVWAGIGTRTKGLRPNGKAAIRTLLNYQGSQR